MNTLLVIEGPTGVGKTDITLRLAKALSTVVINADSRQIYKELPIGTAAPSAKEQQEVKHYFVGTHSLSETYSAAMFEHDVLCLLEKLFVEHEVVIMSGGSMMYVDAVCNGLDNLPTISALTRLRVQQLLEQKGLAAVAEELKQLDPLYYAEVDLQNPRRVCHAVEICYQAGVPYSSLRLKKRKPRSFNIIKFALSRPRPQLYERINLRVDQMVADGLLEEAQSVLAPYNGEELPNSLNTVGYKELYKVKIGEWDLPYALEMIKQNSRRYAKRQLTWLRSDSDLKWININEYESENDIITTIIDMLHGMQ